MITAIESSYFTFVDCAIINGDRSLDNLRPARLIIDRQEKIGRFSAPKGGNSEATGVVWRMPQESKRHVLHAKRVIHATRFVNWPARGIRRPRRAP